jgi:hypothetical protein
MEVRGKRQAKCPIRALTLLAESRKPCFHQLGSQVGPLRVHRGALKGLTCSSVACQTSLPLHAALDEVSSLEVPHSLLMHSLIQLVTQLQQLHDGRPALVFEIEVLRQHVAELMVREKRACDTAA